MALDNSISSSGLKCILGCTENLLVKEESCWRKHYHSTKMIIHYVKVGGRFSESFEINLGVRQD